MAKANVTAVLLAGGVGARIRALYPDVPKPMIPILGRPFLYWPTAFFAHHGVRNFLYSTGYKGEQIAEWCLDDTMPGLTRRVRQERVPLGTGGGLLNCLDACTDWVLVSNGDSLCLGGAQELLAISCDRDLVGGLVGVHQDDTARYGSLEIDGEGRLMAFREKIGGAGFINGGTYLFRKDALQRLPLSGACSIERELIPLLLAASGRIEVVQLRDAPFIDIGTPETVVQAEAFIDTHRANFTWQLENADTGAPVI